MSDNDRGCLLFLVLFVIIWLMLATSSNFLTNLPQINISTPVLMSIITSVLLLIIIGTWVVVALPVAMSYLQNGKEKRDDKKLTFIFLVVFSALTVFNLAILLLNLPPIHLSQVEPDIILTSLTLVLGGLLALAVSSILKSEE